MAVGATFGALNCMYSAIASRQVEIATLRAIGFGGAPVVDLGDDRGARAGARWAARWAAALAYLYCDGASLSTLNFNTFSQVAFDFRVTPGLLLRRARVGAGHRRGRRAPARHPRGAHPGHRGAADRLTRFRPRASLRRSGTPRAQGGLPVHDLVIDNAVVIDGLGTPARARRPRGQGRPHRRPIGARSRRRRASGWTRGGLVLAPGIVDIHTHYDAQLTWDPVRHAVDRRSA